MVSGSVFTPKGKAPVGGWPVIAFGHGTTGIDEPCAPSLSENLLGFSSIVAGYANLGYAVALPDYEGLGSPGVHPYTDARTAGLNMIDAVRALRHTFPDVSNRWAAVGGSQGGGAAWAADEQAASYAPELDLVGAVAYVPAADVAGIVDKAVANTMTDDQALAFQSIVESLARMHPDVRRDDYRRGAAAKYWDALVGVFGPEGLRPGGGGRVRATRGLRACQSAPPPTACADCSRRGHCRNGGCRHRCPSRTPAATPSSTRGGPPVRSPVRARSAAPSSGSFSRTRVTVTSIWHLDSIGSQTDSPASRWPMTVSGRRSLVCCDDFSAARRAVARRWPGRTW